MDIAKGTHVEVQITDMDDQGRGIGKADGMAVFVSAGQSGGGMRIRPVVGDTVRAVITKTKKSYALAHMEEIIVASDLRNEPFCEYADSCGGCPLQHMSYEGQLALKEKQVRDKLVRIAGIAEPKVSSIIGMEGWERYRNKAQIPVSNDAIGFYKAKSHSVVDCASCLINSEPAEALAEVLRRFMRSDNISAYDPETGKGLIRRLIVRTANGTGEVMAILVINGKGIPNHEKLIQMMDDAVYCLPPYADGKEYSLESFVFNINKKKDGEALGEQCVTVAGKQTITDTACGLAFEISPLSFYQVNAVQMEELYGKVLEYAGLSGRETVLDVYCGVGTIGLFCADKAKKVIGIESLKQAVLDANRNAVINGIVNAEYLCGRAEEILPKLSNDGLSADVLILDPPRAGCKPELLAAVGKVNAKRIIYVSCDPATLARDLKRIMAKGYEYVEATPIDMFPWSAHVECVVLLSKVQN